MRVLGSCNPSFAIVGGVSSAPAHRKNDSREVQPMAVTVIATLKVKAGSEKQFEDAARAMIEKVHSAEPGTQTYVLHRSVKEPTTFVYYEVYQDQAAFDAHGKT